jgi:hypothetical protein
LGRGLTALKTENHAEPATERNSERPTDPRPERGWMRVNVGPMDVRHASPPQPDGIDDDSAWFEQGLLEKHGLPIRSTLALALRATVVSMPGGGYRRHAIFADRLGIDRPARTLREVGDHFGLTRERVRQIIAKLFLRLRDAPVTRAVRTAIDRVLKEHVCVTVAELAEQVPWLSEGLASDALADLMAGLCPSYVWWYEGVPLVALPPTTVVEAVVRRWMDETAGASRSFVDSDAMLLRLADRFAAESGLPALARTLHGLARKRFNARRRTFTEFVREFVAARMTVVSVEEVVDAAHRAGYSASTGVARSTLAAVEGVYAVGHSAYGVRAQIFPRIELLHEAIAMTLAEAVNTSAPRQWHADELLDLVREAYGAGGVQAVGDAHRLAALLRERSSLRYLGRMVFAAAEGDSPRLDMMDIVREVLRSAGGPLRGATLLERVRERRGIGTYSSMIIFGRLVEVARGVWGLPERDVPLCASEHKRLVDDALAALAQYGPMTASALRKRLVARGSVEAKNVNAVLLRSLLVRDGRFRCGRSRKIACLDAAPGGGNALNPCSSRRG